MPPCLAFSIKGWIGGKSCDIPASCPGGVLVHVQGVYLYIKLPHATDTGDRPSCPMAQQGYLLHHYQQAGLDIRISDNAISKPRYSNSGHQINSGQTCTSGQEHLTMDAPFHQVIQSVFQSALWRNVDGRIPPAWDPEKFGWDKDIPNRTLNPTTLL